MQHLPETILTDTDDPSQGELYHKEKPSFFLIEDLHTTKEQAKSFLSCFFRTSQLLVT